MHKWANFTPARELMVNMFSVFTVAALRGNYTPDDSVGIPINHRDLLTKINLCYITIFPNYYLSLIRANSD